MKSASCAPRLLLACAGLLAGCGQTGPLYLPDQAVKTPVEVRPAPATTTTPAATQPAAAPPASPPTTQTQDDAKDKPQPQAPQ